MIKFTVNILSLVLIVVLLSVPVSGNVVDISQATVTLDLTTDEPQQPLVSTLFVHADEDVKQLGYIVNGISNVTLSDNIIVSVKSGECLIVVNK